MTSLHRKVGSEGSDKEGMERGAEERGAKSEYFGWVYHLGVNSIGHEYCHLRFLIIRGKYVEMYKRDPQENPGIKPIRKGVVGQTLMVEELGRRKVNNRDVYVLRFYSRLDETKKGEIACAAAGEAQKWMEAFDHAKQQAEFELSKGRSAREKLNMENEINLEGHRPRVRRYANGLRRLIRIGQGPETLLRHSSDFGGNVRSDGFFEGDSGDAIEAHQWKCVRTINGIRIFEDVADTKSGKGALVKSVGVVDASADTVFEVLLNLEKRRRYEWDMLTGDLELVDSCDGHYDVVYGTCDPKYFTGWYSKKDFVFSRQWFRGQDGTYTILQFPVVNKKKPPRHGYQRTKINSLKEYIGANPALKAETSTTIIHSKISDSSSGSEFEDSEVQDEFYDAIAADSSSEDEESDNDEGVNNKDQTVKLKNVSWAITGLALRRTSARDTNKELDANVPPVPIDSSQFSGSMRQGNDETDTNCWTSPSGNGFMIRGKTYLKDHSKVMGGDPFLKLIAVDWFKVEKCTERIALHPKCLVQSEAGKKLPFILVFNLEVPAKPNYSLVLYYAADRPINQNSSLGKFVDGNDIYRDSRFKLIPSIVQGYWMVKRAVGTKACLLGKAVTCKYLRQDNFLEIDLDIGSSSVARSVIGLVLGYVTSIVVDLAILVEGKEEKELPEYILGTVRLNRVSLDSAVPLEA
ncbi:protein ENHANCED DISEASE RESISTANCE 2-like isoform X3 [Malania oleifera]|uniref:protein ENHANCED DISEASE RESISTANCE 2-like isoform X3 n=1 Tax=Malania oleifera TaxID=397392 RepID=UPI0025AE1127|nr:protein ENHANCED DISEASE RESISTANCE 2-like isoform X3 [Malania oleifera]